MCSSANTCATTTEDIVIPDMLPNEVAERLEAMRRQEEAKAYQCTTAVSPTPPPPPQEGQQPPSSSRAIMCDWCFQMVDACGYRRETVEIAMSFLDRFLSVQSQNHRTHTLNRQQYQLVAITGLYVAIKLYEAVELTPQLLSELSRGEYTAEDIVQMEERLLEALQWRMCGPTRMAFVQHLLGLLPRRVPHEVANAIAELARFQTEIATSDDCFVTQRPSMTALACILNALESVPLWNKRYREEFLRSLQTHGGGCAHDANAVRKLQTRLLQRMNAPLSDFLPMLVQEDDDEVEGTTHPPTKKRSSSSSTSVKTSSDAPASSSKTQTIDSAGEYSPVCVSATQQQKS